MNHLMNIDEIKIFAKNEKELKKKSTTNYCTSQPRYQCGIWNLKICLAYDENKEKEKQEKE